jgi:hypothetical protein
MLLAYQMTSGNLYDDPALQDELSELAVRQPEVAAEP